MEELGVNEPIYERIIRYQQRKRAAVIMSSLGGASVLAGVAAFIAYSFAPVYDCYPGGSCGNGSSDSYTDPDVAWKVGAAMLGIGGGFAAGSIAFAIAARMMKNEINGMAGRRFIAMPELGFRHYGMRMAMTF